MLGIQSKNDSLRKMIKQVVRISVFHRKYNIVVSNDLSMHYNFSWTTPNFSIMVEVEYLFWGVTKATVETDMLGNDFH